MSNIKLIHDDFFAAYQSIKKQSIDLILTDPPYNQLQEAGQDWDVALDWEEVERNFAALLKPAGQLVIFCDARLMFQLVATFGRYLEFRCFHIWYKPGGSPVNQYCPIYNSEHILVFKQKEMPVSRLTFNPREALPTGKPYSKVNHIRDFPTRRQVKSQKSENLDGKRWIKTVIEAPSKPNMKMDERTSHPTQKPISLLRPLIRCYSNQAEVVFDPFAGSASTLIAAYEEGRNSIGIEIEAEFYEEARKRIARVTAQGRLFG